MAASECQVLGCLRCNWLSKCQFESLKMNLCEFVRGPRVSDWAKFAVQTSKDEAPTPLLTVGLLFIFMHLLCVHLATLKICSVSESTKLQTKDIAWSSKQQWKQGYKSHENPAEAANNSGNEATSLMRILLKQQTTVETRLQVSWESCWSSKRQWKRGYKSHENPAEAANDSGNEATSLMRILLKQQTTVETRLQVSWESCCTPSPKQPFSFLGQPAVNSARHAKQLFSSVPAGIWLCCLWQCMADSTQWGMGLQGHLCVFRSSLQLKKLLR